jgi:hypothetical protein
MILNEAAIRKMGFSSPQEAIGGKVKFDWRGESYSWTIIGVVKDFHFQDLHVPIEPYGFQLNNRPYYNYIIVHAKASDIAPLLSSVTASWHKLNPNEPFEYSFLDEDFQKNYEAEEPSGFNRRLFHCHCDSHFLSWIVWFSNIQRRTTHKRNWSEKSAGCKRNGNCSAAFKGFFKAGGYFYCRRIADCLVGDA